jgi:hypothetical protein
VAAISWYQVLIVLTVKQQMVKGTYINFHTKKPVSPRLTVQRVLQLQDVRTDRSWHSMALSEQRAYTTQLFYFVVIAVLVLRLAFWLLLETGVSYAELACHVGVDHYDERLLTACAANPPTSWLQDTLASTLELTPVVSARVSLGLWLVANVAAFVGTMLGLDVFSRIFYLMLGVAKVPLLDNPWYSTTLAEFWGKRWVSGLIAD